MMVGGCLICSMSVFPAQFLLRSVSEASRKLTKSLGDKFVCWMIWVCDICIVSVVPVSVLIFVIWKDSPSLEFLGRDSIMDSDEESDGVVFVEYNRAKRNRFVAWSDLSISKA